MKSAWGYIALVVVSIIVAVSIIFAFSELSCADEGYRPPRQTPQQIRADREAEQQSRRWQAIRWEIREEVKRQMKEHERKMH